MSSEYPILRDCRPPPFLSAKYGSVSGILQTLARETEDTLPPFDARNVEAAFPTIEALFDATASELESVFDVAPEAAQRYKVHLQRMLLWEDLSSVKTILTSLFDRVIAGLPRSLADLEQGSGRDPLDPFIVAFAAPLLGGSSQTELLRALLIHKCMMKLEDLIGNLHQEALGRAAGLERVPEPVGVPLPDGKRDKESWHETLNPYPGVDVRRGNEEFYQLKNKTGSAKGGDGARLGRQLREIATRYPESRRYYASVVGRTLSGHRSMGAVRAADPDAEVLVGLATFQQLGLHRDTADIVMELYLEEFDEAIKRNHYDVDEILARITQEWVAKHPGENPALAMLRDTITPLHPDDQSSRTYMRRRKKIADIELGDSATLRQGLEATPSKAKRRSRKIVD